MGSRGWILAALIAAALGACTSREGERGSSSAPSNASRYALGREPNAAEVAAMDIDAAPSGEGLPAGRGDAARGRHVYAEKCAICHGGRGEGVAPNPALVGRDPRQGFPFAADFKTPRTIGNYWPYAVTLFDYIRRAMPVAAPGSLTNDEVYSLTAYLLAANEVVPEGSTLDSATLAAVRMPARRRFVRDDRRAGPEVK